MLRILEAQAPAKQSAGSTISTLSGRLASATLLEDRRAAILGLRSFAKIYPASVASGGLRNLIGCLSKDIDDVDTTKIVLETLLMLFSPEESSPEASDEIALWLADEFTQRQENITALLDLLEGQDFFCRLYALQLISAISAARPERTQECVYTAPLGVSRLVAILDDQREAIRNESLLLLTELTPTSRDLQKLVAFENVFDRVFAIIDAEGALVNGDAIIQDCLSLLGNLLRNNSSNQSFFRETGHMKRLSALIDGVVCHQASADDADWAKAQRDKNTWGILALLRLLLSPRSLGTQANQVSCWQNGILAQLLELTFRPDFDAPIRAEALDTAADLIRSNRALQEAFGQQRVPSPEGKSENVISGLLDLALATSALGADIRLGAGECLKAYFYEHAQIRQFFLRRAVDGHLSKEVEPDNILTILLTENAHEADPTRIWLASVIFLHLLNEDYETKELAMSVAEGNADDGEEVVTCIQTIAANLIAYETTGMEDRVFLAYLMVLCTWLWENPDAVNDFVTEGTNLQSIVQIALRTESSRILVSGLCCCLLGIVYEFSTKDSPVPRETVSSVLASSLGREQYVDRLTKLREHPIVRDFEVLQQGPAEVQPQTLFDQTFIDFLKDNYSRLLRAIDRPPGLEVSVLSNGVQKGISRELVDSLKAQLETSTGANQKFEAELLTLERKLGQEQADHRKAKESSSLELGRIKHINKALQDEHEAEIRKRDEEDAKRRKKASADASHLQEELARANEQSKVQLEKEIQRVAALEAEMARQVEAQQRLEKEIQRLQAQLQARETEFDRLEKESQTQSTEITRLQLEASNTARHESEREQLQSSVGRLQSELDRASKEHVQDLQTAHEDYSSKAAALEKRLALEAEQSRRELEERRQIAQTELDDMLMVLGDLEEKRSADKARLKELGESISDDDDD